MYASFISFTSLFLSVILLQLSTGGIGPLDALSGITLGFSTEAIGLLGSAHFVGFFLGCWLAPRVIGSVGHARAFAVFAAAGTIGAISHMMLVDAYAWAAMRINSGLCVAGCYTVIESWLQAKVTNKTRGRALGLYRVADTVGSMFAQLLISLLAPAEYFSYNVIAILCCASLLPLALTRVPQPKTPSSLRLKPLFAARVSPMAVAGVIVAGVTSASFRAVGPIYGQRIGLANDEIGYFLAAFILGGAIAQYPAGWLADRFDRRSVLIGLSVFATATCVAAYFTPALGIWAVFVSVTIFGLVTLPIYSVAAAHANDFVAPENMVELSSSLLFFFAVGAIVSPLLVSVLISNFGPSAMFAFIAIAHVALCVYGFLRKTSRPTSDSKTPYVYTPRTSLMLGRLLKWKRDRF